MPQKQKYTVIFRACDVVNAINNNPRPFNLSKNQLIKVCFLSLLDALQGVDYKIIVLGDKLSDLIRDIKAGSSKFINDNKWIAGKFKWQEGYGAFSYSKSHIDKVAKYILNQEEHHKKYTFKEEYISLLKKFEINYNEKYLFEWIDL